MQSEQWADTRQFLRRAAPRLKGMPAVEISVDADLVRRLLIAQFGPLDAETAAAPLTFLATGWDNAMFRLGDHHVVRLPVRSVSAPLIAKESQWLPLLASDLPVDCPVPIFTGSPQEEFPWPWTIVPWVGGQVVDALPVQDRSHLVDDLADVMIKLHRPAPGDAPVNPVRGVPLQERESALEARWPMIIELYGTTAAGRLRDVWADGLAARRWTGSPVWVHGDPHPFNLLHHEGSLSGLIDFGDLGAGDPASDLATAWLTFDGPQRARFQRRIAAYGDVDEDIWRRSAAWAVVLWSAFATDPESRATFAVILRHTLGQLAGP